MIWRRLLIVTLMCWPLESFAKDVPDDDFAHLTVLFYRSIVPTSVRLGVDGFELGRLNESTDGFVHRWGKDWLVAGLGLGYGSNFFMDPEVGIYGEIGAHHLLYDWWDLRFDIGQFFGVVSRNMRTEMMLGFGFHL